jgi:Plasmid pRiA4b ORF-3-like protein
VITVKREGAEISLHTGAQCQKEDWPAHKAGCRRQNYILRVDLHPEAITNPRITRTLSCPATATFAALHQALLVAFGWSNTHLYDFDVFGHDDVTGHDSRFSLRVPIFKITDLETVDDDFSFGMPAPPNRDSSKVKLFTVLEDPKTRGKNIVYNYDFGDGWEHIITCTGRTDSTTCFVCLGGEGHGCAEDVGGYRGWQELLRAYDAQNQTRDQKERIAWFEKFASNKDPRGLRGEMRWRWDQDRINAVLRELDNPTRAARPSNSHSALLISLDKKAFFDEMYSEVIAELRSKVGVTEVTHIASAMHHLSKPKKYAAVVVTDPAVMEDDFIAIQEKLVDYAYAGGTVVLGFHFSSFAQPDKLCRFFKNSWALNWKVGDYLRSTFSLNPQANSAFMSCRHPNLPHQYSMKALHLSNTKPEDRIYISDPGSAQSPAIYAKYGYGYLGWIGDVNTEVGTTYLLLTMCGVSFA